MTSLKNFAQKLEKIKKQRNDLQKEIKALIKELREKYPTTNEQVEFLLDVVESTAENELNITDLENYYKKGYQDIEIGASYREILRKYHGDNEDTIIDPRDYFNIVVVDYGSDTTPFASDIKLDEDKDIIEYVGHYLYDHSHH